MGEQLSKSSFSTFVPCPMYQVYLAQHPLGTLPKVSDIPCPTSPWYFAQGTRHTLPKSQSIAPIGKKISMGEKKVKIPSGKSR